MRIRLGKISPVSIGAEGVIHVEKKWMQQVRQQSDERKWRLMRTSSYRWRMGLVLISIQNKQEHFVMSIVYLIYFFSRVKEFSLRADFQFIIE